MKYLDHSVISTELKIGTTSEMELLITDDTPGRKLLSDEYENTSHGIADLC